MEGRRAAVASLALILRLSSSALAMTMAAASEGGREGGREGGERNKKRKCHRGKIEYLKYLSVHPLLPSFPPSFPPSLPPYLWRPAPASGHGPLRTDPSCGKRMKRRRRKSCSPPPSLSLSLFPSPSFPSSLRPCYGCCSRSPPLPPSCRYSCC